MNECTFIILGATGDLAKRKLIPALYRLIHDHKIDRFIIVGAARDESSADGYINRAREHIRSVDDTVWRTLQKNSYYYQIDFTDQASFNRLTAFVSSLEKEYQLSGNRIVYLAVPSLLFCPITQALGVSKLVSKARNDGTIDGKQWHRIVYEKPFGLDELSAHEINQCINTHFDESQIYRIDHYLTKELVSSIVLVRFTNMIFEPLWNNQYIDEVQIIVDETVGMEGRGAYYDEYGVLKDVVQNHMLQLLSLVAMELPEDLDAHHIRNQKAATLQHIRFADGLLGQYRGYTSEKNVSPTSQTPTFAALKMFVDTPRWQGVPFYIKTGKCLEQKNSSIHIKFKEVPCRLRAQCIYSSNYLTIQIDPISSFSIQLNTKKPGEQFEVTPVQLAFNHDYTFGTATPEAYEILLEHIMAGEQSVSVRLDEIEYAWKIIDAIQGSELSVYKYMQASNGPQELLAFNQRNGIVWRI
ncbi:MAG: glucose-6-phosphate dehydrogenase [Candidatus Babeliales bacterium]